MRDSRGFTLVELLVVISIIGVLSTLAVFGLNSARSKSRDSKRVTDVKQIQTALELYYADFNGYPGTDDAGVVLGGDATKALCSTGFDAAECAGNTYMMTVPRAQTPIDGDTCAAGTSTSDDPETVLNNDYEYISTNPAGYTLTFCLGGKVGSLEAGVHVADPNGIQ